MRRSTLPAFALLAYVILVGASPAHAIVGASEEAGAEAAHIVMVLNRVGGTAGFCSGVVLAPDVVMTAAHCVPEGADLRIHIPDAGKTPVLLPVTAVMRHPGYRADAIRTRERSIDLALIRLSEPLPARFTPAALGTRAGTQAGARFTIAGYGVTREGDGASSGRLRRTVVAARAPLSAVLLWAADPAQAGSGACTGDSGAPIAAEGEMAVSALVVWSAGAGQSRCGSLTQGLWLAPTRPWITRVLGGWGRSPLP